MRRDATHYVFLWELIFCLIHYTQLPENTSPTSYPDYTIHPTTHAYTLSPNGVVPPQQLAIDTLGPQRMCYSLKIQSNFS